MAKIKKKKTDFTYSELEQAVRRNLQYWKRVRDQQKAHDAKVKSITFRNEILNTQKRLNYQNEKERLENELSRSILPHNTIVAINNRLKDLERFKAELA